MTSEEKPVLPPMRADERGIAVLCHLSTMVPLWTLVANGLLYFLHRESSRVICFHARQGINFQILFLVCVIPLFLLYLLSDLVGILLSGSSAQALVGGIIVQTANVAIGITAAAYAACCIAGIVQALRGRVFVYPLVGRQLYRHFVRSFQREDGRGAPDSQE